MRTSALSHLSCHYGANISIRLVFVEGTLHRTFYHVLAYILTLLGLTYDAFMGVASYSAWASHLAA